MIKRFIALAAIAAVSLAALTPAAGAAARRPSNIVQTAATAGQFVPALANSHFCCDVRAVGDAADQDGEEGWAA